MSSLPHTVTSPILKTYQALHQKIAQRVKGQDNTLHYILACYFTGHHVLLEDYPGTGKTTLAKTLAESFSDTEFKRLQFTPDLLPSDVTGINIYDPGERAFCFHKGPVFCDILLADEINRASPRTQAALLEAMAENQVTIEGKTYPLSERFFVVATQNPVEFRGTYPLPEAQMDRFGIQCSLGYLDVQEELKLLNEHIGEVTISTAESQAFEKSVYDMLKIAFSKIHLSDAVKDYIVTLISTTRTHPDVKLPLSPRATLVLASLARALAFFRGKDYVTAEHIKELAPLVLSHRILLTSPAMNTTEGKKEFIHGLLEEIPIPG